MTKLKSLTPISIKSADFGPLIFRTKDSILHYYGFYGIMQNMGDEHHNLYFIEEGCKEGDLCLWNIQHEYKVIEAEGDNALMHYKIVATTDYRLIKKGIPSIPDEYVRHYAYKNGDIGAVDIETESFYVEPPETIHSNRGHFIDIPKLIEDDIGQKEVVIYHEPVPVEVKMDTTVIKKTDEEVVIEWSGPTGHGILKLDYNGKGGYNIDAEYIGFETLFDIIKNTSL